MNEIVQRYNDIGFGIGCQPFRWNLGHRRVGRLHWFWIGPFFIQWKFQPV